MNGVHDMGGMHGMGPVAPEPNEPVFHERWEARTLALNLATAALGKWSIDAGRHSRERIPPAEYLRMSYYEKWLVGLITLLEETGLVSRAELDDMRPSADSAKSTPALTADRVAPMLAQGRSYARPLNRPPRFVAGQRVRARKINPTGHTRLPRYVRGNLGVIDGLRGAHVFPDSSAHFGGENPQHLYSVRFPARELWGEAASPRDAVYLDLWEDYLEPA
jgi:nitrile hydratase beta subunit